MTKGSDRRILLCLRRIACFSHMAGYRANRTGPSMQRGISIGSMIRPASVLTESIINSTQSDPITQGKSICSDRISSFDIRPSNPAVIICLFIFSFIWVHADLLNKSLKFGARGSSRRNIIGSLRVCLRPSARVTYVIWRATVTQCHVKPAAVRAQSELRIIRGKFVFCSISAFLYYMDHLFAC